MPGSESNRIAVQLPDAYAPDEPEVQADVCYHSSDEQNIIVAHVRELEQQVANLRQVDGAASPPSDTRQVC